MAIFAAIDWPGRWYPFGTKIGYSEFRSIARAANCRSQRTPGKRLEMIGVEEVYAACSEIF